MPVSDSAPIPKLRMAPPESAEQLAKRVAREKLTQERHTEVELERSLAPFRVGSVDALNAAPLTRGLEDEVICAPPSKLAEMLRRDELDAALVSVVEVLLSERYDILDGIAVASLGEVKSVFLAHRKPLEELCEVHLDPASITSVNLLKVLLAERGLRPGFKPLSSYSKLSACTPSVHDTSTLRGWWEREDGREAFAAEYCPGLSPVPEKLDPKTALAVLGALAKAPSELYVVQLQDALDCSRDLRSADPDADRINVPGSVDGFNWTWRMGPSVERLEASETWIDGVRRACDRGGED